MLFYSSISFTRDFMTRLFVARFNPKVQIVFYISTFPFFPQVAAIARLSDAYETKYCNSACNLAEASRMHEWRIRFGFDARYARGRHAIDVF